MGFFSNWPFSNLHNLNLDWIIEQIKNLTDLSNKIWERVKPLPGGDPSTVTAAQAFGAANYAQQTAEQAGASAKTANTAIDAHKTNTSNPHQVTAEQVGAEPAFTLLAVAKGGTGGYNPETARASLNARKDFAILPVSEGGTGSSTPEGARSAIGAKANFDILPVAQGGTGASDALNAVKALGAQHSGFNASLNWQAITSDTNILSHDIEPGLYYVEGAVTTANGYPANSDAARYFVGIYTFYFDKPTGYRTIVIYDLTAKAIYMRSWFFTAWQDWRKIETVAY